MTPHSVGRCHAVTEGTRASKADPFSKGSPSIDYEAPSAKQQFTMESGDDIDNFQNWGYYKRTEFRGGIK